MKRTEIKNRINQCRQTGHLGIFPKINRDEKE